MFMSTKLRESELILNSDGSIYHLALLPGDIAHDIITVGDPDRVDFIAEHFDSIRVNKQNREFKTVTGSYQGKEISIIATGIGTDNIDIVFNELDALVNIDFLSRTVKDEITSLNFYRIGTSGSLHPEIQVDEYVISAYAIGLDALGHYYNNDSIIDTSSIADLKILKEYPYYITKGSEQLIYKFGSTYHKGVTITAPGFYAPQGRNLRRNSSNTIDLNQLYKENIEGISFTNLEMETAGIYLLAHFLGHQAISLNAILANRISGTFSIDPTGTVKKLIEKTLELISSN